MDILRPDLEYRNNRGSPLSPLLQVCITLNHYAGGHFQRISGCCGDVSTTAAHTAIHRVTNALYRRAELYITVPSVAEMEETSNLMLELHNLPGFAAGVDGVQVRFEEKPRDIPDGWDPQRFYGRKLFYSVNVQAVCNQDRFLNLDVNSPGRTHDAWTWANTPIRGFFEQQNRFMIAGDSAYPISESLMKPYRPEVAVLDPTRRQVVFNNRLNAIRTRMTENIFGRWKRRFPILKGMRVHLPAARRIMIATAVLHNMAVLWRDEDPEHEEEEDPQDPEEVRGNFPPPGMTARLAKVRGESKRSALTAAMPM